MGVAEGAYTGLAFEALGDRTRAFEALKRIDPAGVDLAMALRDPQFDQMRSDPRFRRIVAGGSKARSVESESTQVGGIRATGTTPR